MARAIELAKQGRFTTAPNPNVGCVIVLDDQIIGEGFHQKAGSPHAEVYALRMAQEKARGATCYVTLEPCSHFGQTPPCANALIKANVARVVVAMVDPNPKVAGRGIDMLKAAGIDVEVGLLSEQAHDLNLGFITRMTENRPYVRLKMAASLDGKTALSNGESKWITGSEARSDVQQFRAQSHAILSTASTVIMDDASLNVRFSELGSVATHFTDESQLRQPIRIILDNHKRIDEFAKNNSQLKLMATQSPIILVNGKSIDSAENDSDVENVHLKSKNSAFTENDFISRIEIEQDSLHNIDLTALMSALANQGINDLWVEAGATLAGKLLESNLVDDVIVYLAPKLMGSNARGLAVLNDLSNMADVPELRFTSVTQIGNDLRIIAKPVEHNRN